MQFNYVLVVQDMVSLCVLAVIDAGAPDSCEPEFFSQLAVDGGGQVHNGGTGRQGEWVFHIRLFAGRLGVNAYDF